jgi:hypothetical protein
MMPSADTSHYRERTLMVLIFAVILLATPLLGWWLKGSGLWLLPYGAWLLVIALAAGLHARYGDVDD